MSRRDPKIYKAHPLLNVPTLSEDDLSTVHRGEAGRQPTDVELQCTHELMHGATLTAEEITRRIQARDSTIGLTEVLRALTNNEDRFTALEGDQWRGTPAHLYATYY